MFTNWYIIKRKLSATVINIEHILCDNYSNFSKFKPLFKIQIVCVQIVFYTVKAKIYKSSDIGLGQILVIGYRTNSTNMPSPIIISG